MSKQRLYECKYFEFEYDDLGKNYWCHNQENPNRECDVEWKVCMKFCPYFKRKPGSYRVFEVTERDRLLMDEAKKKLEEWKADKETQRIEAERAEYQEYIRLKKKYEGVSISNKNKGVTK